MTEWQAADLIRQIKNDTADRYVDRHKAFDLAIESLEKTEKIQEISSIEQLTERNLSGLELAIIAVSLEKLKKYEDLKEQGKLLKLPCAVGDTVWFIKSNFSFMSEPKEEKIRKIEIIHGEIIFRTENRCFNMRCIGKTVFLTKEEAEAALKKMGG